MRAEKRCAVSLRSKDSDREEDRERLFRLHGCLSFQGLRGKEQTALVVGFLLGDSSYSELTAGTEPGTAHLAASLFQRQRQSGGTVQTVGRARATKLERAPGQRSSTRKETSSCLLFLFTGLLRLSVARNQHNTNQFFEIFRIQFVYVTSVLRSLRLPDRFAVGSGHQRVDS